VRQPRNQSSIIEYRRLLAEEDPPTLLDDFDRHQETTCVWFLEDGLLKTKSDSFIDDWGLPKRKEFATYLQEVAERDGIVYAAFDNQRCIGFASVEPQLFGSENQYLELTTCHVDRRWRGKGIGRALFTRVCHAAKTRGAIKLYISSHPSIETQAFYRSMGCLLAQEINSEILAREPLDIHLEKHL
jgi:GNAT superfamily N-acetyltransferase